MLTLNQGDIMGLIKNKYRINTSKKEIQLIDALKKKVNSEALSKMASDLEDFNMKYESLSVNDKILDEDMRRTVAHEYYSNLSDEDKKARKAEFEEIFNTIGGKMFFNGILEGMYRIFVNTSFMSQTVEKYNKNYEKMPNIQRHCSSSEVILNTGEVKKVVKDGNEKKTLVINLNTSKSNDIITRDFRDLREDYIGIDEKMQKTAFWANQLAHAASDEVKTFAEQFMGVKKTKEESQKSADLFARNVQGAYSKYMEKPEYKFRQNYLSQLIEEDGFDFKTSTDPDFLKAKKLMNDANLKCKDVTFLRNFLHCMEMQECTEQCFQIKNQAIKSLILYLNDPEIDEEEKLLKIYAVKDNKTKDRKKNTTTRLLIVNKSMDRALLQFNDCRFFNKKALENIALSLGEDKNDIISIMESIKTDEIIDDEQKEITEEEATAISELCAVTATHFSDIELNNIREKYGITLEEYVSPLQYFLAFYGGGVSEVNPGANKVSSLTGFVKKFEQLCNKNKKEFKVNEKNDDQEVIDEKANKFAKNYSIVDKIKAKIAERSK